MKIIGIDPGTAITGYGVIKEEKGKATMLDYGCVFTKSGLSLEKRLKKIYDELTEIFEKEKPQAVACEDIFFAANVKTALKVGQARGVILLAAENLEIPVFEYTPLQVKQAIVGYGRADKKQVQKMIQCLLKLKDMPKPDDAADALAVAVCHLHSKKLNEKNFG